jgi:hypothetical protein
MEGRVFLTWRYGSSCGIVFRRCETTFISLLAVSGVLLFQFIMTTKLMQRKSGGSGKPLGGLSDEYAIQLPGGYMLRYVATTLLLDK